MSGVPFDPNATRLGASDPLRTQAMTGSPVALLTVRVTPGRPVTMANGPAVEAFLVEIEATASGSVGQGVRTPLNLCLVIDRSGSMEGLPLEYVRQACSYIVDLLTPNDVLSLVTFSDTAELLMPPQRVVDKGPIKEGIARIWPGNTTNLFDGLALGAQQLLSFRDPSRTPRLVLLTDGEPTTGITDFAALVQQVAEMKAQGITCTLLGFGPDYNEELLATMAKRSGGNYAFISRPELIPEVFRGELEKLLTIAARNLELQLRLARWVHVRSVTGLRSLPSGRDFVLPLADLERGSVLQQVIELEFPNHPLGHYRVAHGTLSYQDAVTGQTGTIPIDFEMEFSADRDRYSVPVHPLVSQAHQVSLASRAVEKTILGLKTGQLTSTQALQELQKTQALLLQDGRLEEAREVTQAMQALRGGQTGEAQKTLMGTVLHLDQGKKGP